MQQRHLASAAGRDGFQRALDIADYAYILETGRVVLDGTAQKLTSNEDVQEFYLGVSSAGRKSLRGW